MSRRKTSPISLMLPREPGGPDTPEVAVADLTVLAVGDSTLSGEGLDESADIWLSQALDEVAGQKQIHVELVIAAESGGRLKDIGRQLNLVRPYDHDVIVVAVGTNDVTHLRRLPGLFRYRKRYRRMLQAVDSQADQLVVTGVGDLSASPRLDRDVAFLPLKPLARLVSWYVDRQIRQAVKQHEPQAGSILFVDPRDAEPELSDGKRWLFTNDDFHPNAAGHKVWADVARQKLSHAVRNVLKSRAQGASPAVTANPARNPGRTPVADRFPIQTIHCRMGFARIRSFNGPDAKPVVVVIPDAPNSLEHYDEVFKALATLPIGVLGIEMPGLGQSTSDQRFDFSLRSGADWILSVLDHEEVERAVIATSCINGLWAAKAAQIDDRVVGLVLGQTPDLELMKRWGRSSIRLPLRIPIIGDYFTWLVAPWLSRWWYRQTTVDPADARRFERLAARSRRAGAQWKLGSLSWAMRNETVDPLDHLGGLTPTHIWGGGDRTYWNLRVADDGANPDIGHFPDLEDTPGFVTAVSNAVAVVDTG